MPLEIDDIKEPKVVQESPDFDSFLDDIELGRIATEPALSARLRADGSGRARDSYGYPYAEGGKYVQETRKVTKEQSELLKSENKFFVRVRETIRQTDDFSSYYQDLREGKIPTRQGLAARLNADSSGSARSAEGYRYAENGSYVTERRKVSPEQAAALKETARILERDKNTISEIRDAASFIGDISVGKIAALSGLNARFNADGQGNARDSENFRYVEGGQYVLEQRRVKSKVRKDFIKSHFTEVSEVQKTIKLTQDYYSFIDSVLNGDIPTLAGLTARLNADGEGNARSNGYRYAEGGLYVIDKRKVSPAQGEILKYIFRQLESLDEEAKQLIRQDWQQGAKMTLANQMMERRRNDSVTQSDLEFNETEAKAIADLSRVLLEIKVQKDVYTQIAAEPGDVRKVFELLRDYEIEDDRGRAFSQGLTALAYRARRADFTNQVFQRLAVAADSGEIGGILESLSAFADSPFDEDAAQALALARFVYEKEVAIDALGLLDQAQPSQDFSLERYKQFAGSLPIRPSVEGFDYAGRLAALLEEVEPIFEVSRSSLLSKAIGEIALEFRSRTTTETLELIDSLPVSTSEDVELQARFIGFYKQYLISRRGKRPEDYKEAFSFELESLKSVLRPDYEFDQNLGRNVRSLKYLVSRFRGSIAPLFQSLRGDAIGEDLMDFVSAKDRGVKRRERYIQRVDRLERQRPLSDIERNYLQSVESLTLFNPHLVALANTSPAITSAYLESYFNSLSAETVGGLKDGDYIPLILVGLGPNGIAAAGELVRSRPELADSALFIDEAELPGGPFAIPRGPAWELNSANSNEITGVTLPPAANGEEIKTVRAYGSPLRWYPGERIEGSGVRQGSINTTVDYLVTPDSISDSRYPDNADMALILQLQAAMLAKNLALRTQVESVEKAPQDDAPNRKRVTLRTLGDDGQERTISVYTDELIVSAGLGRPNFGFKLQGSRAQEVLDATEESTGFPKLADTLTAFRALASQESDRPEPGETIVIYGNGNSADTLLEYIGGLFQGGNRSVRNIKKIYVVTTGELSRRPRYAAIADIRSRGGRGNLVEIVNARVGDISFADDSGPAEDRKLYIYDASGSRIQSETGQIIEADHVIAAAGFRPALDEVFGGVTGGKSFRDPDTLKSVTLPTNPNVAVADTLADDPSVLLVGTASRTGFEVSDKLRQLPQEAREALLRNGAENAVAIGFRAPDTQAATRLFLDKLEAAPNPRVEVASTRVITLDTDLKQGQNFEVDSASDLDLPPTRRDIDADSSILSPLLLRPLSSISVDMAVEAANFTVLFDDERKKIVISSPDTASRNLAAEIGAAVADPFFQAYAREALRRRRNSRSLEIILDFKDGRVNPRTSFVQPV